MLRIVNLKFCIARADNLTICYRKNKLMSAIDNEFRQSIADVVSGCTQVSPRGSTATLTML